MKQNASKRSEAPSKEDFVGSEDDRPLHERIAKRAYELHQQQGSHHGNDLEDWLEAELKVLSEQRVGRGLIETGPPIDRLLYREGKGGKLLPNP